MNATDSPGHPEQSTRVAPNHKGISASERDLEKSHFTTSHPITHNSRREDNNNPPPIALCSSAEESAGAMSESSFILDGGQHGLDDETRDGQIKTSGADDRFPVAASFSEHGHGTLHRGYGAEDNGRAAMPSRPPRTAPQTTRENEGGSSATSFFQTQQEEHAPLAHERRVPWDTSSSDNNLTLEPVSSPQQQQPQGEPMICSPPSFLVSASSSGIQLDFAAMSDMMHQDGISDEITSAMSSQELLEAWVQQQRLDEAKLARETISLERSRLEVVSPSSSSSSNEIAAPLQESEQRLDDAEAALDTTTAVAVPNKKKKRRCYLTVGAIALLIMVGSIVGIVLALQGGGTDNGLNLEPPEPKDIHAIVVVQPDAFPQHTSWILREGGEDESGGETLGRVTAGRHPPTKTTVAVPVTEGKTYTFRIADLGQDGVCCRAGRGYFYVLRSDTGKRLVAGDGDFGKSAQYSFVV